jgi:hypothetical protein
MNKKIIALGISAFSAAALTFGTVGPASAVAATPTLTEAVCSALPASVTDLLGQVTAGDTAVTTTAADLVTKKAALLAAVNDLVPAVIAHIQAVSDGANSVGTGQVLAGKGTIFADKVVAANNALTANFDAQRSAYLTGLNQTFVTGVQSGLCPVVP